jgi:hypothetical protein
VTVMAAVSGAGALGAVLVGAVDMCGLFRSSRMSDRSELKVGGNFFCSFPLLSLDFRVSPAVSVDFRAKSRCFSSHTLPLASLASSHLSRCLPLLLLPFDGSQRSSPTEYVLLLPPLPHFVPFPLFWLTSSLPCCRPPSSAATSYAPSSYLRAPSNFPLEALTFPAFFPR